MEIVVFILLAVVWAAFLLPSVIDSRRRAPITTTKNYERSTALLASVASTSVQRDSLARRRTLVRRRRVLVALGTAAVVTLVIAVAQASMAWLIVTLVCDALLAAYIAILLQIKQQRAFAQQVVQLAAVSDDNVEKLDEVRIVAG